LIIMTSRTHDIFAFASLISLASYYPPASLNLTTTVACLVGNVVGSLLPDADQATNRLWDLLPAGNQVGKVFRNLFLHHRTLSHSILGAFLIYEILSFLLAKFLNPAYVNTTLVLLSIMIGYLSHLLADSFTEEGVPLLFPFKFKFGIPPISSWRIKTGKWFEKFVVFPGIVIYIIWFSAVNQAKILDVLKLIIKQ
jgi:inner membrane protein